MTLHGKKKEIQKDVKYNSQTVAEYARKFPARSLVFLGAWIRKEVVRILHRLILGPNGKEHDDEFL